MAGLNLTISQTGKSVSPVKLADLKLMIRQDESVGTLEDVMLERFSLAATQLIEKHIGYPLTSSEMTAVYDLPVDPGISHAFWNTRLTWNPQDVINYPYSLTNQSKISARLRGPIVYADNAPGVLTSVVAYDDDNNPTVVPEGTGYKMLGDRKNILVFTGDPVSSLIMRQISSIVVKYNGGWAVGNVPDLLILAVEQTVAYWYDERANVGRLSPAIHEILAKYDENILL